MKAQKNGLPKGIYRGRKWCYRKVNNRTVTLTGLPGDAAVSEIWRWAESDEESRRQVAESTDDANRLTVGEMVRRYIDSDELAEKGVTDHRRRQLEVYFRKTHRVAVQNYGTLAQVPVEAITAPSYDRLIKLPAQRKTPASTNTLTQVLKLAWRWAYRQGLAPTCQIETAFKYGYKPRTRVVTGDERGYLLQYLDDWHPWARDFVDLAYRLRSRRSEVAGLRWGDILPGHVVVRRLKGSKGNLTRRNNAIDGTLQRCYERCQPHVEPLDPVVCRTPGKALTEAQMSYILRKVQEAAKAADLDPITLHDQRRSGITDTPAADRKVASGVTEAVLRLHYDHAEFDEVDGL